MTENIPASQVILNSDQFNFQSDKVFAAKDSIKIDFIQAVKLFEVNSWRGKGRAGLIGAGQVYRFLNLRAAIKAAERSREKFLSFTIWEELALAVFSGSACFVITSDANDWDKKFLSYSFEGKDEYYACTPKEDEKVVNISTKDLRLPPEHGRKAWLHTGSKIENALLTFRTGEGHIPPECSEQFQCYKIKRQVCFTPVIQSESTQYDWESRANRFETTDYYALDWIRSTRSSNVLEFPINSLLRSAMNHDSLV